MIFKNQTFKHKKYFAFDFLGSNDAQDENVKSNMSIFTPSGKGNDESIGISFFASGLIILIIGLLILFIINRVF